MKNTRLILTFFCLWLTGYLDASLEDGLAYFSILTIGLLHGSNDLNILSKYYGNQGKRNRFWKNLGLYVILLLGVLLVFVSFPKWALPAFVLLSAYHFGEQHWKAQTQLQALPRSLLYLAYGGLVLFMIFYIKINTVLPLINDILQFAIAPQLVEYGFYAFAVLYVLLSALNSIKSRNARLFLKELFYLALLAIVIHQSSMLMGFALYFVLWHSLPSITDQVKYLYGEVSNHSFITYWKDSWFYWVISLIGLGIFYVAFRDRHEFLENFLIAFLAAVTFPHVLVMHRMED